METEAWRGSGSSIRFRVTSMRDNVDIGGNWAYRCDDCNWTCVAAYDPVSCADCGGDTNRAPQKLALELMGVV